jgi:hypothetical protein
MESAKPNKSTATAAQNERIMLALKAGPKTTDDLRSMGCYQSAARIHYLRRAGYKIDTQLFNGISADGYAHKRMARYTLLGVSKQDVGA